MTCVRQGSRPDADSAQLFTQSPALEEACYYILGLTDLLTKDDSGNTLLHHCAGPVTLCQKIVHAQWESGLGGEGMGPGAGAAAASAGTTTAPGDGGAGAGAASAAVANANAHKQFYFRSRNTDGALAVHMVAGAPRGNNTLGWLIQKSADAYPTHCHPTPEELAYATTAGATTTAPPTVDELAAIAASSEKAMCWLDRTPTYMREVYTITNMGHPFNTNWQPGKYTPKEFVYSDFLSQQQNDPNFEALMKNYLNATATGGTEEYEGYAPLHFAARAGINENVEFLLAAGASKTKLNAAKATPLEVAMIFGNLHLVGKFSTGAAAAAMESAASTQENLDALYLQAAIVVNKKDVLETLLTKWEISPRSRDATYGRTGVYEALL